MAVTPTGAEERVEDSSAVASRGVADEQPILFSNRGGPDGVLDRVGVEFGLAVLQMPGEWIPVIEQLRARFA